MSSIVRRKHVEKERVSQIEKVLPGKSGQVIIRINNEAATVSAFDAQGREIDKLTDRTRHPSDSAIEAVIKNTGVSTTSVVCAVKNAIMAFEYPC